jgi:hypothetical protein
MSVSYLSELSDQLRASVSTFRLPDRVNESSDGFGGLASPAALPVGSDSNDQFYQQDLGGNGDWNQNFSADFLSLPQGQENAMTGSGFQFSFNGQSDMGNQPGFAGMPQLPAAQQGFDNKQFGNFAPNFGNQPAFGELSPFDAQPNFENQPFGGGQQFGGQQFGGQPLNGQQFGGQPLNGQQFAGQPFGGQQFGGVPESGYNQPNAPLFPASNQMPALPQQNFPPAQGGQGAGRPRWRNPQQGTGPFSPEQMPFPGTGNGHLGQ